jgi:hypothetical protein
VSLAAVSNATIDRGGVEAAATDVFDDDGGTLLFEDMSALKLEICSCKDFMLSTNPKEDFSRRSETLMVA